MTLSHAPQRSFSRPRVLQEGSKRCQHVSPFRLGWVGAQLFLATLKCSARAHGSTFPGKAFIAQFLPSSRQRESGGQQRAAYSSVGEAKGARVKVQIRNRQMGEGGFSSSYTTLSPLPKERPNLSSPGPENRHQKAHILYDGHCR